MSEELKNAEVANCSVANPTDSASFRAQAVRVLRTTGHRITNPRILVIKALAESNQALSAYAIHERVAANGGKIDVVTVYRILSTFQELGLVHRIGIVDGFIPCRIKVDHEDRSQHLICSACGCVTELPLGADAFERAANNAQQVGFKPQDVKVEILGVCSHCQ
jgi:Fe2+ or Zn2+ uptake regulation protein